MPIELVREPVQRYLDRGGSLNQLAIAMDWTQPAPEGIRGDTTRLQRAVGLKPQTDGGMNLGVSYETAERVARGLGLDPHEVGA